MTMEVNHMTNCTLACSPTSLSSRAIARKLERDQKQTQNGRRGIGEEVSCPPLLLPPSFLVFALVLEMAMAIRFSFFLFCCFVVLLYVLV